MSRFSWVCLSMLLSCVLGAATQAHALADLIVPGVDTAGLTTNPQTLQATGTVMALVKNDGDAPAPAGFHVVFFEDRNGNGHYDVAVDLLLGDATVPGAVAPGAQTSVSVTVNATVTFSGNLIYAFADSGNAVPEGNENNNTGNSGTDCEFHPPTGQFQPVLEWAWTSSSIEPSSLNVMTTPGVADINGDGIPDVVFGSTASTGGGLVEVGVLRALNGANGAELFTVTDPSLLINAVSSVAIADVDLDGVVDIIACDASGSQVIAFSNTGAFKWRSPTLELIGWGAPSIANLDGVGPPEIVIGRQVLNGATGALLWSGGAGSGNQAAVGPLSAVADVDLDGSPDVVAGNTVYSASGAIKFINPALPDGFNAIGNFDADPNPEIVLVAGGNVYLLEHDMTLKWGPSPIPGGGVGGPPTIEDYDGDGQPEIGVAGANRYAVFETDGTLKWAAVTQDSSSNRTGSSVFDFDGDGSAEVVYHDELTLRVYRGADGAVLFETPSSSCTWYEYPVIADVDADGNAEIVTVANNNCGFGAFRGVYVYGDSLDRWVPARKIWNQHTYHITNVNDDGSIPAVEANNWLLPGFNNYRTQNPPGGNPFAAPDLTASLLRPDLSQCPTSAGIVARLGNGGANVAASPVKVAFYDGDPSSGGVLLGVVNSGTDLDPGEFEDLTLFFSPPLVGTHTICAVADDNGTGVGAVSECDETNNKVCTQIQITCNQPPELTCLGEVCNDAGKCTASPACSGGVAKCVDPDGDMTSLTCTPPPPYPLGTTSVAVTCNDGRGGTDSEQCSLKVKDCEAPKCNAPAPKTFECNTTGGVKGNDPQILAWLAGASASDNCGTVSSFTNNAPGFFPVGTTVVTWVATDNHGNASSCSSTVKVADTKPPYVDVDIFDCCLTPANHKFVKVGKYSAKDKCDPNVMIDVDVTSDEATATEPGTGGAQFCPDAKFGDGRIFVRAERSTKGNGRVYEVIVTAKDASGNVTKKKIDHSDCKGCQGAVCVPRSGGSHGHGCECKAKDDGQDFDALVCN